MNVEEANTTDEVIAQLTVAKERGAIVYVDNDDVHAYDADENRVLSAHPHTVMTALLEHFGVSWDSV